MCGIAGIYSPEKFRMGFLLGKMTDALTHRGPDGQGYVSLNPGQPRNEPAADIPSSESGHVWLGHRRLSIIDIEGSKQPLCNEDGTVWVTFNGEIYNYLELRKDLEDRGHIFVEAGDTEVLVHLWEEYGCEMFSHIIGMFAFCIYDLRKDQLIIARDRYGQKPLYYWQSNNIFAFASELQSLWELDNFPKNDLDQISAGQYFRYGYIPSPRTIYKNVNSLLPGHFLTINDGKKVVEQYWKPQVHGVDGVCDLEQLEDLLDQAVGLRLRSDVPLGAFLSGGIDSSLVVASMARQTKTPVETFTITTGEAWCDESETARSISGHLGTRHHEFLVKPDLVDISQKLARHYGQPFADYSSVPTYYVSRETRKHVTVALTGDGGDELFAGYQRYANYRTTRIMGLLPLGFRKFAARIISKREKVGAFPGGSVGDFILCAGQAEAKGENHSFSFHQFWREKCFQPDFSQNVNHLNEEEVACFRKYFNESVSDDPLEKWLEVDQRMYLADDILVKVDIASMAVSLECRAPFLDHRLAEVVNRYPVIEKLQGRRTKVALREIANKRLPREILELPKKGFTLPLASWLRNDLKDWAYDILFRNQSSWETFLRPESVQMLWEEHQSPQSSHDHSLRLWIIISWCLWAEAV